MMIEKHSVSNESLFQNSRGLYGKFNENFCIEKFMIKREKIVNK